MAWQLIYTSAPRLLEAGRSGFGTVARHRQISPLLVSAIERASQFARLPGLDAARVVFAHRSIAIGGGRFHVLSCIRDAGADYTGRTNHIAHHLIAEPREIARLGAEGPSPADVLLAMPWISSWNDPPRHLDAADEVPLADFAPEADADGTAWAHLTGDPAHAWLLANGEASRGAYIVTPGGADLRSLFAESFRLMPERGWPHGFITSLQPSDEASDFRWIGVEESSPLLAHASASARPLLDLTSPASLPAPEIPASALSSHLPEEAEAQFEETADAADASGESPALPEPKRGALSGDPVEPVQPKARRREPAGRKPSQRERSPRMSADRAANDVPFRIPKWAWITAASVLVGAGLGFFTIRPMLQRMDARKKVAGLLEPSGYFGDEPARIVIAKELVPDLEAEQQAALAARSADRLAWLLGTADFEKMKSSQSAADLQILDGGSTQMPAELGKVRELVRKALALHEPPDGMQRAADVASLTAIVKERRNEISRLLLGSGREATLTKLTKELYSQTDRYQADGLLALIQNPILPPDGLKAFEKAVGDFSTGIADLEALKTVAKIQETIAERASGKHRPASGSGSEANVSGGKTDPAVSSTSSQSPDQGKQAASVYLIAGNDALRLLKIKELRPATRFRLVNADGQSKDLVAMVGKLRIDFQRPSAAFLLDAQDAQSLRAGDDAPPPPYKLLGESPDSIGFQIWVEPVGSQEPLPEMNDAALTRAGDLLHIAGIAQRFAGPAALLLRAPAGMDGKTQPLLLPVSEAWDVNIEPLISDLRKQASAQRSAARTLRQTVSAANAAPPSLEALQKKANEYSKIFISEEARKEINPKAKTGGEIVGNYAVALVAEWEKNFDQNLENLRSWGHALRESGHRPTVAKDLNESLRKEILTLEQKYRSSKISLALANLRDLANTLATMLGDTKGAEAAAKVMASKADAGDASAETIEKLPLLIDAKHLPAGDYALIARTALDREVVIAVFKIHTP